MVSGTNIWTIISSFFSVLFPKELMLLLEIKDFVFSQFFYRYCILNQFDSPDNFLYPLKTENLLFPDVFRGYRKKQVALNGLIQPLINLAGRGEVVFYRIFCLKFSKFERCFKKWYLEKFILLIFFLSFCVAYILDYRNCQFCKSLLEVNISNVVNSNY